MKPKTVRISKKHLPTQAPPLPGGPRSHSSCTLADVNADESVVVVAGGRDQNGATVNVVEAFDGADW